jgi:hypothetical protein
LIVGILIVRFVRPAARETRTTPHDLGLGYAAAGRMLPSSVADAVAGFAKLLRKIVSFAARVPAVRVLQQVKVARVRSVNREGRAQDWGHLHRALADMRSSIAARGQVRVALEPDDPALFAGCPGGEKTAIIGV